MNIDPATLDTKSIAAYTGPGKMTTTMDFILNVIPTAFFDAFAKGEILQVLLIAMLFGFALHRFGGRGTLVVAKWTHELDMERLHAGLNNETWVEADEPEILLNQKTEHMAVHP